MSVKAYLLLETDPARTRAIVEELRGVEGVREADEVMGPYDIAAIMEMTELADISSVLGLRIRTIEGVRSTLTCVTLP